MSDDIEKNREYFFGHNYELPKQGIYQGQDTGKDTDSYSITSNFRFPPPDEDGKGFSVPVSTELRIYSDRVNIIFMEDVHDHDTFTRYTRKRVAEFLGERKKKPFSFKFISDLNTMRWIEPKETAISDEDRDRIVSLLKNYSQFIL